MLNKTLFQGLLTLVAGVLSIQCATAEPITWTLVGVTFADGGTASGSFTYNVDTNTATLIDIVTTSGTSFGGATYLSLSPPPSLDDFGIDMVPNGGLADFTGSPLLVINLTAMMTDSGGVIPILASDSDEGTCSNPGCKAGTPARIFSGGELVSNVPEPSSLTRVPIGCRHSGHCSPQV